MSYSSSSSSSDESIIDDVDVIELVGPDRITPASEHLAWKAESAVKLRMGSEWPLNRTPVSLPTVVRR